MVIRKRNSTKISVESEENNINENNNLHRFSSKDKKTYADEVLEVLTILDKNGTDIYDLDRYPGMYLNRNRSEIPLELRKKISEKKSKHSEINKDENTIPDNLFQYFKNKSK